MLKFTHVLQHATPLGQGVLSVTLPYAQRVISRQKVTLDNGTQAGLFLPRGTVLQDGDHLQAESGELLKVQLAQEQVSTLYCRDALLLARACYHLGNRHVALQIEQDRLRYQHDPVLDEMLYGLGLQVVVENSTFTPEPGAYGGGHRHAETDVAHTHAASADTAAAATSNVAATDTANTQSQTASTELTGAASLNKARRL